LFFQGVVVTTYQMMGRTQNITKEGMQIIEKMKSINWGLIIFDEVQVAPAKSFINILNIVRCHCKLGNLY
jgi:DNA excision repair protein ERCC-3